MNISWKTCWRVGLTTVLVFFCVRYFDNVGNLIAKFLGALTPILIGFVMAYLLNILMSFYERHYFPKSAHKPAVQKSRRIVCLLMAVITFCAIVAIIVGLVIPELVSCVTFLVAEIPPLIKELLKQEWVQNLLSEETLASLSRINWQSYISKIIDFITAGVGDTVSAIISAVSSIVSGIATAFLSIIFTFYMLTGRDKLQKQFKRLIKGYLPPKWTSNVRHFFSVLNKCFHRFIVGQCMEAVILGSLCMLGMFILRIPYAAMIGVLVGFTALIPIAGAYIGAGVGAIMILTVSPIKALIFLIFLLVLQQVEGNLIYPRVVGNSIGLPAIWVLAAITIGGSLMGIMGMMLGVPVAAAMYRLIRESLNKREGREILEAVNTESVSKEETPEL